MTLADLGFDEGLPALLGDWLVKIDEVVRAVEADQAKQAASAHAASAIAAAFGSTS